jgi:class 3 adenylate cyclase
MAEAAATPADMTSNRTEEGDDAMLRLFASYSPAEVVLRYAAMADPKPPEAAEQQDFEAAIGFVDVSGFTALSEKLNKDHGRKGAELLNQCAPPPLQREPSREILRAARRSTEALRGGASACAGTSTPTFSS